MTSPKESRIRELALFRQCRAEEVRWIARVADELDVPPGRTLAHEGSTVREFVVVLDGVLCGSDGDGEVLFGPGSFYGELGLVDDRPHGLTVETRTPARLLVFDRRAFRSTLDRVPSVGRKLLREMVERLRSTDGAWSFKAAS